MKIKINDKWVKVLKFETKLILSVVILGLIFGWILQVGIYFAADKVANAYTSEQPLFK